MSSDDSAGPGLFGFDVFAGSGQRLGRVDHVYVDALHSPVLAVIATTSRLRRRLMYVPLQGAVYSQGSLMVRCGAALARQAPTTKRGQVISAGLEADLHRHYDLPHQSRADGTPRLQRLGPARHRR